MTYSELAPIFVRGAKSVPLSEFLTILESQAILLANEAATPGIPERTADFARGRRYEVLSLIDALSKHNVTI